MANNPLQTTTVSDGSEKLTRVSASYALRFPAGSHAPNILLLWLLAVAHTVAWLPGPSVHGQGDLRRGGLHRRCLLLLSAQGLLYGHWVVKLLGKFWALHMLHCSDQQILRHSTSCTKLSKVVKGVLVDPWLHLKPFCDVSGIHH